MRPDHRHELKTNELAEWIANFPQWAKENRITIIGVLVIIVVVGGLYIWRLHSKKVAVQKQIELTGLVSQLMGSKMQILSAQAQGKDLSYILVQRGGPADRLKIFAQNTNNDQMAALALIKQAEALRTELHYRPGTISKQDLTTQINQAKASYTEALETHLRRTPKPSLEAIAKFGLGICEEELGNFEKAQQIYRDITETGDFEGTVAKAAAEQRLETMADYKTKVVFKPSPEPKPPIETSTSSVEPIKPAEVNLPADTNLPIDVNLMPPAPNTVPEVPDINREPNPPLAD